MNLYPEQIRQIQNALDALNSGNPDEHPDALPYAIPLIDYDNDELIGFAVDDVGGAFSFVTLGSEEAAHAVNTIHERIADHIEVPGPRVVTETRSGRITTSAPNLNNPPRPQVDEVDTAFRDRAISVFAKMLADADEARDRGLPAMSADGLEHGTRMAAQELGILNEALDARNEMTRERRHAEALTREETREIRMPSRHPVPQYPGDPWANRFNN